MTKQEFKERVGAIAEVLTDAMNSYNEGKIFLDSFKEVARMAMATYPYGWGLADDCSCEFNEDLEYGECYTIDELGGEVDRMKEFVADFIADAENWDRSRFYVDGSNSFLIALLGYEGENY